MAVLFKHYKGGIYAKLAVARDANNSKIFRVIYRNVETGELWDRELDEFEGTVVVNGETMPRFAPHSADPSGIAKIREEGRRNERERVIQALNNSAGCISHAAKELGWHRCRLYRAMRRHGLRENQSVSVEELERELTALQAPQEQQAQQELARSAPAE